MAGRRGWLRGVEGLSSFHAARRGFCTYSYTILSPLWPAGREGVICPFIFGLYKAFSVHSLNKLRRNAAVDEVAGTSMFPETGIEVSALQYMTKGERLGRTP